LQAAKYLKYLSEKANITLLTTPVSNVGWKKKDESHLISLKNISESITLPSINSLGRWGAFIGKKIFKPWMDKPDADFLFHWKAKRVFARLRVRPDLIYSRSTPFSSAVLGLKLKAKLNVPWVMHMSDPWTDSPYGTYKSKYNKSAESKCFSKADLISFTTCETQAIYSLKYPECKQKFFVSPNVFDKEEITQQPKVFAKAKLVLLHSGNLYKQRNIEPVLRGLQLLNKDELDGIEVQLAGNMDEYNVEMIRQSSLDCVKMLGSVSAAESYALQQDADVLISIDKPLEQEFDKVFLPSKIQDYIAARKVILSITGPGSATYHTVQNRFGYCFDHGKPNELAGFLRRAVQAYYAGDRNFFIREKPDDEFEASRNASLLLERFRHLKDRFQK